MDFFDLLDDWKTIAFIAGGLFIGAIWLSTRESRKALSKVLYRICAAVVFLACVVLLVVTWWPPSRIRNPQALGNVKRIALVTLAADTELLIGNGGEDATVSENPKEARALAYVQMGQTAAAFQQSPIAVLPFDMVMKADAYRQLSYPIQSTRKSGLFSSTNVISAADGLSILPIRDAQTFSGLADALGVDALLILQTRYELDWDWRDSVPLVTLFTDPYWYGNVRTRAWLVGRDGAIIWRYRESKKSKIAERARAYNYLIVSGSEITAEQSIRLLMDAIGESANRLTSVLAQDVEEARRQ